MAPDIFISYRRKGAADVIGGLLYCLKRELGKERLFVDCDGIEPGVKFSDKIGVAVGNCKVLLVVIDDEWLNVRDSNGNRRLDDPEDFVRVEIRTALARRISVIPVLVTGAVLPDRNKLPSDIQSLVDYQAVTIRSGGKEFDQDIQYLVNHLNRAIGGRSNYEPTLQQEPSSHSGRIWAIALVPMLVIALFLYSQYLRKGRGDGGGGGGEGEGGGGQTIPPIPPHEIDIPLSSKVSLKLTLIPQGEFIMGSDNGDEDETPVHKVAISSPFYMSVYEITQEQYFEIMGKDEPNNVEDYNKGPRRPIENITWRQAVDFCIKLNRRLKLDECYEIKQRATDDQHDIVFRPGNGFRLPTEAEWEYACRAGSDTEYAMGDDPAELDEYAWHPKNSGEISKDVGTRKPNQFGLFDMHGNVFEWCHGGMSKYPSGFVTDTPVLGWKKDDTERVARGGTYYEGAFAGEDREWHFAFRSAFRRPRGEDVHENGIGFRVVRSVDTSSK